MNETEIKQCMKSLTILYDTREHQNEHLQERLAAFQCPAERTHLDFGDYTAKVTLLDGSTYSLKKAVVIERKKDLAELCGNFTTDRPRFIREFNRAQSAGSKTYLLVERGSWEKAYAGAYRSKMNPQALVGSLTTWLARYDCQLIFCEAATAGKLIYDVLFHEMREALKKLPSVKETIEDDLLELY